MNNNHDMSSNICAISENNLEAVLFSEFSGTENMIITSDSVNNLSELDGTLCYDETTNELVYVNMIQPNLGASDSLTSSSQSVFAALGRVSALADGSTFSDSNSVMFLTNGSIVIPNNNEDDDPVSAHANPLFLQFVENTSDASIKGSSKCIQTIVPKPPVSSSNNDEFGAGNDSVTAVANLKERVENTDTVDVLRGLKPNFRCELCPMAFSENKEYQTHRFSHTDKVHKCSHCGISFNKMKNLILHEALHNPQDTVCPLSNCQKKFRRLASLKAHIKLHEEEETLLCTKCGEEFRNQICLELHYKSLPQCRLNNSDVNDSTQNVQNSTSKLCKLCNRKFQDLSAFIAHKKEHEKIKKALATKSHRKKTTSSSKPSSRMNRCKECPKLFPKPSQLVRHMRIHTGERPYECTECNKAFNQANSLKIHMLKHTGDRPYLCMFCHSGFSQRGNLRQHINRVHSIPKVEDLVYECSECPCIFKKICSLNAHRNRVHRKGYRLVLSSKEMENEMYLSGQQDSSRCTSPEKLDNGKNEQMKKSSGNKNPNHTMYMCPECTSTFKTTNALKNHLNEVHIQLPIPRDEQENSITLESNLDDLDEEEMKNLLKKRTTVNTITITVDKGGGELWHQKVFIKKDGNRQLYQCSHCPKESVKLNEMIRHTKTNVIGKLFKCEYCQKTFSQHSTFKTHLSLHATAKAYHCQVCQQEFSNPAELNAHLKSHNQISDDVMCMTCFKTYSSKEPRKHQCLLTHTFLDMNVNSMLKVDNVTQSTKPNEVQHVHDKVNLILPPYICSRCNITFKSYGKLKSHLQDHDKKAITLCDSRISVGERSNECLNTAQVENKNISEKKCSKCDQCFKDARSLARHRKKAHYVNTEINVTNSCRDPNESVLNTSSTDDITKLQVVNAATLSLGTNDVQSDVPAFVVSESPVVDLNAHQTVDYSDVVNVNLNLKCDFFTNDKMPMVSAPKTSDNDQTSRYEEVNIGPNTNELISKKNDVSYLMTTEPMGDCFLDSQVTTLPVEGTVATTDPMFNVTGDIIYKCTSCNEQYSRELDLQKHFQESKICNNGMPNMTFHYFYACNTCYLTFKSLNSFLRHLQTHNGSGTYTCIYCDKPNRTEAELTQHIAAHALKKEYPCVHCGELAETAEAVKRHITDVHLMSSADSKALETKRKKTISSELLLTEKEKLMLVDHKPSKYSSISEKVLSSLLKKNIKKDNDDGAGKAPEETEKSSKTKKKRTTPNVKENKCNYCDRSFKKMCDLIRHIRIHTGEKPFKCDYCSKCFTVKSILNCHLKTHFTVKNIFCHICNRFFSTVGSLKIHMRLHTGDRPYKCLYCKESFRTSGHRDSHQKRHLGEKDRARTVAIEAALAELGNEESLELSLGDAINLQDTNFLISEITDIEDFKFQENAGMDLVDVDALSNSNDCAVCRKSFKKKSDLEEHAIVHNADRELGQSDALRAHGKEHIPSLPVHCDVCQRTFASTKNLKIHKIQQHPELFELPFQENKESFLLLDANDKSSVTESFDGNMCVENTNNRNKSKWTNQEDLSLSVMVGKNSKTDVLNDFFIMEKQFDLNSMISDFFPDN